MSDSELDGQERAEGLLALLITIAFFALSTPASAIQCHEGTVSEKKTFPDGHWAEYCAQPSGARDGEYGEFASDGRQLVWGSFASGVEHGVWTMDVEKAGERQTVFVMFDGGKDVTDSVLTHLPPTCEAWNGWSEVGRAGALATLALLSSEKLSGGPAEVFAAKRVEASACFAKRAESPEKLAPATCDGSNRFSETLTKRAVELARDCIVGDLPKKKS